jgi:hypothetical protein
MAWMATKHRPFSRYESQPNNLFGFRGAIQFDERTLQNDKT